MANPSRAWLCTRPQALASSGSREVSRERVSGSESEWSPEEAEIIEARVQPTPIGTWLLELIIGRSGVCRGSFGAVEQRSNHTNNSHCECNKGGPPTKNRWDSRRSAVET